MSNKLSLVGLILIVSLLVAGGYWWLLKQNPSGLASPFGDSQTTPTPPAKTLEKYSFTNLRQRGGQASVITLDKDVTTETSGQPDFFSYLFSYNSEGRKITGLLDIPNPQLEASDSAKPEATGSAVQNSKDKLFPVVIMVRGYVDKSVYEPGVGTKRAAEYFTSHGYLTIAPDFLGYGGSDNPPDNVWEERFLRPVAVMDLIASVPSLKEADPSRIFIWGHSNGGMIALSVLAITEAKYPTTLWAPVTQFFPYDVLYYTYEYEDKGKALRQALAEFEKDYEVSDYSFDNYLSDIQAPIQLQQGKADEYIPLSWSNGIVDKLKELDKDITYYTYAGADHNLKGSWSSAVAQDLEFFKAN